MTVRWTRTRCGSWLRIIYVTAETSWLPEVAVCTLSKYASDWFVAPHWGSRSLPAACARVRRWSKFNQ